MPDRPDSEWELDLKPVHLHPTSRPAPDSPLALAPQAEAGGVSSDAVFHALHDLRGALEQIDARLAAIEAALSLAPQGMVALARFSATRRQRTVQNDVPPDVESSPEPAAEIDPDVKPVTRKPRTRR